MKKTASIIMRTMLVFLLVGSMIVAANAYSISNSTIIKQKTSSEQGTLNLDFADIPMTVWVGDGCGCVPIIGAVIKANALDNFHNDSGITDDEGHTTLTLLYDTTYRLTVEKEEYTLIMMDFYVIGEQPFAFHMQKIEESTPVHTMVMRTFFQRILNLLDL